MLRAAVVLAALAATPSARTQGLQGMATADRLEQPGFWPTEEAPRGEYVGTAACARCHPGPAATQPTTSMARTLARAVDSDVLRSGKPLTATLAGHDYELAARDGAAVLRATKDGRSLEQRLGWAFGAGRIGQTFVYDRGGVFHESRVSFLGASHGLAFTPKRALEAPRDLEEALGRPIPEAEARRCFSCHSAATTRSGVIDEDGLIPGVTCEACHGPGRRHVDAVEQDRAAEIPHSMLRPSRSDPAAAVDFCGACHATWWDVTLAGEKGVAALRSQPFRLQSSSCWGDGDARLACTACHDPHRPAESDPLAYDARCLACHGRASENTLSGGNRSEAVEREARSAGDAAGGEAVRAERDTGTDQARVSKPVGGGGRGHPKACTVATSGCVTCHMPKYDVPEMHFRFTDHLIRVVHGGGKSAGRRE